ncbi:hypothetical protein BS47DRAFT_1352637 [Hydnum rufescens UP504]|uniref:AB hydrolase-1 domain-containing protein n=1 Tax=Hydnum rufescens UP504 TaxID=1448309 RepID=A0A9P6AIM7_9AGAM|nr:hypothetical protein BS47DRAFT_1352637 [Hydnum rufescens UP504]
MGGIISFVVWLFSDPVPWRGQPHLYLHATGTLAVRKQSDGSTLNEKPGDSGGAKQETEFLSMREFCARTCSSFVEKHQPPWWLPNGHFQTIWCALGDFTTVDHVPYTRTLIRVPDGGTLGLDWTEPGDDTLSPDTPIVVVLHGLTGGSYEAYVRSILSRACASKSQGGLGYRGVVMNSRGCAGVKLTSPQMFSGGYTGDIKCTLLYLSSLYPNAPLLGVGFSLGAGVLTRYVGEEGENCRLTSACVLACPWDNVKNSDKLENRWINKAIYSKGLGGTLLDLFNRNAAELSSFPEPSAITPELPILLSLRNPDFKTVNAHLTSIVGGSFPPFPFPTVEAYYEWASADKWIPGIRIPFLAMNALDDPIVAEVPIQALGKNPWVATLLTKTGGHLGWFQGGGFLGRGGPPGKWFSQPVLEWLNATAEDFVNTRANGHRGKGRYEENGFVMEEDGRGIIGYKEIETGGHVEPIVPSGSAWAGL